MTQIDQQKFTQLCEDVAVIKSWAETAAKKSIDTDNRVRNLEKKWWTIHGAWAAICGLIAFFKDKLL